ncbi:MAG TPA: tetratricopeptide repeat protein [Verrucomicrobiae bacterium]|nr:tetratricopeptide repeat protein [Verrucomicrobiae bacterium]
MSPESHSQIARELCEQKRWRALLDFAEKWLAENTADAKAHYYLGVAHGALGQFVQAETDFRRAVQLDPRDWKIWNNLAALLYENLKRPADGIHCIQKSLHLNPQNKLGWANLATMVGRLGYHDKAIEYADRALALDGEFVEAHLHKAAAAFSLGKTEIVKEVCETLAKIQPEKFRRER